MDVSGRIKVSVEGTGVIESGFVTKRVDERDGDIELKVQPQGGNWVVSYKQDGGGKEVLSRAAEVEEGGELDVGVVVSGIVGVICVMSILVS